MTTPVPARSWEHYGLLRRRLLLGDTRPGDDGVEFGVRGKADGITVYLSLDDAAEVAESLRDRVALARSAVAR